MSILQIIGWSIVAALFIGVYVTIAIIDDIWTALIVFGVTLGLLASEWDYREVRTFRNGDVLRRKDRDDNYVHYMYVTEVDGTGGRWLRINSDGLTQAYANPAVLNDPEWELV